MPGCKGYINYEPYSFITLTPKGMERAKEISYRHATLKEFLLKVLRIDPVTAEETACRMEHAIDKKTFERLVCFIDYIFIDRPSIRKFPYYKPLTPMNRRSHFEALRQCGISFRSIGRTDAA